MTVATDVLFATTASEKFMQHTGFRESLPLETSSVEAGDLTADLAFDDS